MPDYQKDAVLDFFDNHPPPYTAAQFNNSRMVRPLDFVLQVRFTDHSVRNLRPAATLTWPPMGNLILLCYDLKVLKIWNQGQLHYRGESSGLRFHGFD